MEVLHAEKLDTLIIIFMEMFAYLNAKKASSLLDKLLKSVMVMESGVL